jgi:5-methyltetrahydropteroyltriglutamate--homocysteine methyltransferase
MPELYRADHVGSLLRPPELKEARAAFQHGRINRQQLREVEDQAIIGTFHRQGGTGVDIFSDGEFRRTGFQNDLIESVEGYVETGQPAVVRVWQGPGGEPHEQGTRQVVGGKLRQVKRLTEHQSAFLRQHVPGRYKITVPSPSQFPAISYQPGLTDQFYPTRSDLLWEIAGIIKAEINALVEEGVPYIQIDAPRYSYYVDPRWRQHLTDLGEDPDKMFDEALAADNMCVEEAKGKGSTIAIHICRGNNESKWYAEGGYDPIAEKLFGSLNVDRFLLEYDTGRAGTFEPLRFVPRGKSVVLGLVSSKDSRLEPQERLLDRLDEACKYIPEDYLALSPQCGFASTAAGNLLTEEQQWRKIALVVETAREMWGW